MRVHLASSIAVTCAAALALPLTLATPALGAVTTPPGARGAATDPAGPADPAASADPAARFAGASASPLPAFGSAATGAPAAGTAVSGTAAPWGVPAGDVAGSTQSLPLEPLAPESRSRAFGTAEPVEEQGLARQDVRPFSLVGVVWDDAQAPLHGTVQVRTRATADGVWSDWQDVETHNDEHGADPATAEGRSGALHGSTAPLWVGDSDGVEVRVRPEEHAAEVPLPAGLRLELVDPGPDPAAEAPQSRALAPAAAAEALPALTRAQTLAALPDAAPAAPAAKPYIGPRPKIITRKGWGADEKIREKGFVYTKTIKAAFVHHSATGNNYTCKQAPSILRGIYRYHVKSSGWRDFGYNFAVDKCGNIYEGRAGGVAKPVLGAHTLGFNTNSMGIAVLGSYGSTNPPAAVVTAIARLTAWKLGLHGVNPKGKTYLTSGGGNLYKKGKKVKFNAIAGHRDGFATECPGGRLYGKLGTARSTSAKYQGRR
ncbi:peptidoglycan recognition protein [Streptomyces sp. NPDC006339]|uniref:peptidoglycan recognition protein family protein n=1 Tax=Streptomyces sp. NPDC006339 TaxID=3156755 RepID=UPI0033ADC52B